MESLTVQEVRQHKCSARINCQSVFLADRTVHGALPAVHLYLLCSCFVNSLYSLKKHRGESFNAL